MPANPDRKYSDFPGWKEFLDKGWYSTWQEASQAAIKLGFKSSTEYKKNYNLDPKLPGNPGRYYKDFPSLKIFLGKIFFYSTWQEASQAAIKLGFKSSTEYKKNYNLDPKLPGNTFRTYKDFPGWAEFLGNKKPIKKYSTWQEASEAVIKLGIKNNLHYRKQYKKDPKLPCHPESYHNFPGFEVFLGKVK